MSLEKKIRQAISLLYNSGSIWDNQEKRWIASDFDPAIEYCRSVGMTIEYRNNRGEKTDQIDAPIVDIIDPLNDNCYTIYKEHGRILANV